MPAPDYTTEIAALENALAAGELKVESDGDLVWYKSADEILTQLRYFRAQAAAGTTGRPSTTLAVFDPS